MDWIATFVGCLGAFSAVVLAVFLLGRHSCSRPDDDEPLWVRELREQSYRPKPGEYTWEHDCGGES